MMKNKLRRIEDYTILAYEDLHDLAYRLTNAEYFDLNKEYILRVLNNAGDKLDHILLFIKDAYMYLANIEGEDNELH